MQHDSSLIAELRTCYPSLSRMDFDPVRGGIRVIEASTGTRLFEEGQPCAGFPLVLSGEISVTRGSRDGRNLELYRVTPGDLCIVSAAGLLSTRPLMAHATTTATTRLALVEPMLFDRWTEHAPFRQFVFGIFAERLADLMSVVDAVAFQRLDRRLADYLLGHGRLLRTTHQAVADELGTVREMVTRLLNRFEAAGVVQLGRERIEVVDAVALRAIAAGVSNLSH